MSEGPQRRRGEPRPFKPDTGAAAAEEAGVRHALAAGTIALAPRLDGWVEVWEEEGALVEALTLDGEGQPIGVWDNEGLSRWMRGESLRAEKRGLLGHLHAWLAGGRELC